MKIRQKFFVLSGLVGVIIAVMSCVGYYTAYTNLERSVEGELSATVGAEAQGLDGWIHGKANYAVAAATIMPTVGNRGAVPQMQELLKMVASDKEVVGLVNATETGTFVSAKKDNTGQGQPAGARLVQAGESRERQAFLHRGLQGLDERQARRHGRHAV